MLAAASDKVVDHFQRTLSLEVSAKKSVAVAGRPSVASAVARLSRARKLTARRSTQLLGVSSAGGRRRATSVLKMRLKQLAQRAPRIQALRRVGLPATRLAKAAGTPVATYGTDVCGMSCTHLRGVRCAIARAVAPGGGGKAHDATLYAIDAAAGTVDPAFDAHILPIKMLAMAWWQAWQPPAILRSAVRRARRAVLRDGQPVWARVTGPAAAAVASASRIGWTFRHDATILSDDGAIIDLAVDSPAAVVDAVRGAVRRWRVRRLGALLPDLIPRDPDLVAPGGGAGPTRRHVLDFARTLGAGQGRPPLRGLR